MQQTGFFEQVCTALLHTDIEQKIQLVHQLCDDFDSGFYDSSFHQMPAISQSINQLNKQTPDCIENPGRPTKPELVSPSKLKNRGLGTKLGRAAFVHAIAHIEFNAINLALDALYRFRYLPKPFYQNWLQVAKEEAKHFQLLETRLKQLGYCYGDFPAHDGLWDMAKQTSDSLLARMALIPMVFEARGLDVTPDMIKRLNQVGDLETAEILSLILAEEVGHVAFGRTWFDYECRSLDCNPRDTLLELIQDRMPGRRLGPFNYDYRLAAGFDIEELTQLEAL